MTNTLTIQKKTKIFLRLIQKFRLVDKTLNLPIKPALSVYSLNFNTFKKTYTSLLNIIYIFEFITINTQNAGTCYTTLTNKLIYFYAKLSKLKKNAKDCTPTHKLLYTYNQNNVVIFSKPSKQLFLMFFKNKPLFIFTSGLMRIVMNEKRKSGKKLFKVAVSLIKLSVILLTKKNYFDNCYLKLNNVGQLRSKILTTFMKTQLHHIVNHIIFKIHYDIHAQKFKTRRAIKKYVKKRFKLNN